MEVLLSKSSTTTEDFTYTEGSQVNSELDNTMQSEEFQDDDSKQNIATPVTDTSCWGNSTSATYFTSSSMPGNTTQSECDMDLDHLFSIGRDITSPDPSIQLAAVHNTISMIGWVNVASSSTSHCRTFCSSSEGENHSFSDMPHPRPPSTQTSLMLSVPASKILKGKN
jgi:hypothetical protein